MSTVRAVKPENPFAWIPWAYCLFKVMKRSRNTEKVRFFALWWKSVTEENGR